MNRKITESGSSGPWPGDVEPDEHDLPVPASVPLESGPKRATTLSSDYANAWFVPCPTCDARVDEVCRTVRARQPLKMPHPGRDMLALADTDPMAELPKGWARCAHCQKILHRSRAGHKFCGRACYSQNRAGFPRNRKTQNSEARIAEKVNERDDRLLKCGSCNAMAPHGYRAGRAWVCLECFTVRTEDGR